MNARDEDAPPLQRQSAPGCRKAVSGATIHVMGCRLGQHPCGLDSAVVDFMNDVDPVSSSALESAVMRDTLDLANRLLYKMGKR
jgi:hypothetical protein